MKGDNSATNHMGMPILPILLHSLFGVIAIDHQEINRRIPIFGGLVAELLNPNSPWPVLAGYRSLRRASQEIEGWNAGQVIGIDQVEAAFRVHSIGESYG